MAVLKCKMCGGDLQVTEGAATWVCQYCGSKQTLPRIDTEERAKLFDRAGHYLRNNEYDKAMALYERIIEMDGTDPEAHWALLLCKYGVEYVDDPKTHKKMVTCNRTQHKSILADVGYQQTLVNATEYARSLYVEEAKEIDRIQRASLAIINSEEAFDVFICYKQTDRNGRPTKDSRRAQDIYDALTKEGYKVFFSKITLEDKLGTEYEPYIFAALSSAKVMVAVGTSKEYFESTWVRNEWSRFLTMAEQDSSKKLIPAYEDMDPYDMPDEFAMLQALSMDSFTFAQDLVRGIDKLLRGGGASVTTSSALAYAAPAASAAYPLIERAIMCCEDQDWQKASQLIDQALSLEPKNANAYLAALMVEKRCRQEEQLNLLRISGLSQSGNYQKALRFGDQALVSRLEGYDSRAKANYDEDLQAERRKRDAEEQEARRIVLVKQQAEDFLNGKVQDNEASRRQLAEVNNAINYLSAQIQQLNTNRKAFGLFAGEEKRQIDTQLAGLEYQRQSFANEAAALSGKPQGKNYQWRVIHLDEVNHRVLAITKDIIAKMPYHQPGGSITWEQCTLRKWLNIDFYNSLPAQIRSRILETVNQNPNNGSISGGNPTRDKVFLLSIGEANQYFSSDNDRKAQYQGADGWWWLRSPGNDANNAAIVYNRGYVFTNGNIVDYYNFGVRPALWLSL